MRRKPCKTKHKQHARDLRDMVKHLSKQLNDSEENYRIIKDRIAMIDLFGHGFVKYPPEIASKMGYKRVKENGAITTTRVELFRVQKAVNAHLADTAEGKRYLESCVRHAMAHEFAAALLHKKYMALDMWPHPRDPYVRYVSGTVAIIVDVELP